VFFKLSTAKRSKIVVQRLQTNCYEIALCATDETMSRHLEHADEYILAAFLAGDLPSSLRKEIASYIAESDSARDLLKMAQQAMDVSETGDGSPYVSPDAPKLASPQRVSRRRVESPGIGMSSLWKVTALFAGAVLILTITVAILVMDETGPGSIADGNWVPSVSAEQLHFSWEANDDAVMYQVLVMDPSTGEARVLSGTNQTHYSISAASGLEPRETPLTAGVEYRMWILAFDENGDILSRSDSIPFLAL